MTVYYDKVLNKRLRVVPGDPLIPTYAADPDISAVFNTPNKFWKYVALSNSFVEMTELEKQVILDTELLEIKKSNKLYSISSKTEKLLEVGFTHLSTKFSFVDDNVTLIIGKYLIRSTLTYPLTFYAKNKKGSLDISNVAEFDSFYLSMITQLAYIRDTDAKLVSDTLKANTLNQLNNVIDPR